MFGLFGFGVSLLVSWLFASTFAVIHGMIVVCTQLIKLKLFFLLYYCTGDDKYSRWINIIVHYD